MRWWKLRHLVVDAWKVATCHDWRSREMAVPLGVRATAPLVTPLAVLGLTVIGAPLVPRPPRWWLRFAFGCDRLFTRWYWWADSHVTGFVRYGSGEPRDGWWPMRVKVARDRYRKGERPTAYWWVGVDESEPTGTRWVEKRYRYTLELPSLESTPDLPQQKASP